MQPRSIVPLILLSCALGCGGSDNNNTDAGNNTDGGVGDSGTGGSQCAAAFAGCNTYTDKTGANDDRTIMFGVSGLVYSPNCLQVKVGQQVTFMGNFPAHPLAQTCGPASVITDGVGSTPKSFTFNTAGTYGYYCTFHGTSAGVGMAGSIQVVP